MLIAGRAFTWIQVGKSWSFRARAIQLISCAEEDSGAVAHVLPESAPWWRVLQRLSWEEAAWLGGTLMPQLRRQFAGLWGEDPNALLDALKEVL